MTKVSELIDPSTGEWDSALVKDICWEQDAKNILAIPLKQGMMDNLAWQFDSKGHFSVKSAYHVLADNRDMKKNKQKGESSNIEVTGISFKWSNIWRLMCQPKVKQFLWRLAHNSLPLRTKISRRGMDIDTQCPVCWRLDEDGGHCFLKCKMVKKCWIALSIEHIRVDLLESTSAKDMVLKILSL